MNNLPTAPFLKELHYLASKGYRVTFESDDTLNGIKVRVDGEKYERHFTTSKIVPHSDWSNVAVETVLAEQRREIHDMKEPAY